MSKSGSRLPPPPGKKGVGRPLPPEPPSGGSGDAPPPLPSRPAPHRPGPGGGKLPPPPTHQNGGDETPDDYLEPDSWTDGQPPIPPRNFSPTPEDETYEEPEPQQAPPSLPPSRNAPPALPSEPSQEVYDDLEDVVVDQPKPAAPPPAANGYMEETYDVCDIQEAAPHEEPELYEVPPEEKFPPPPEPEPEEEPGLYEFVPETQFNVPPPPSSVPTRAKLPPVPTAPSQPPLPARPPPQRSPSPSSSEGAPDLPGRPAPSTGAAGKSRKSSDGGSGVQINLQMLENRKANLKKVDSKEAQNPPSSDVTDSSKTNQSSDTSSVRDRILKFKEAEKDDTESPSEEENDFSDLQPEQPSLMSQISMGRQALKPTVKARGRTPSPVLPKKQFNTPSHTAQPNSQLGPHGPVKPTPRSPKTPRKPAFLSNLSPQKSDPHTTPHSHKPEPPPTQNKPNIPTDMSNLSIKERIAFMKGQSLAGTGNQSPSTGNQNDHNNSQPSSRAMPTPIKPKPVPPLKPSYNPDTTSTPKPKLSPRAQHKQIPQLPTKPQNETSSVSNFSQSSAGTPWQQAANQTKAEAPPQTATVPPKVKPTPNVTPPTPTYDQEEVYDDGASYLVKDPLHQYDWYHGDIQRAEGDSKLQTLAKDGAFLIRKSSKGGAHPYTLVVLYQGKVYNLKVRLRSDTKVALGEEKTDEMAFKDVPSLIEHHKKNNVILLNVKDKQQYETLLTKSPIAIGR